MRGRSTSPCWRRRLALLDLAGVLRGSSLRWVNQVAHDGGRRLEASCGALLAVTGLAFVVGCRSPERDQQAALPRAVIARLGRGR
jgi:hypothetical protein